MAWLHEQRSTKGEVGTLTTSTLVAEEANVNQTGPAVAAACEDLVWVRDSRMSALGT